MKRTHQKALQFLTAIKDVYRDEEDRQLNAFPKLDLTSGDLTDEVIAILLATQLFVENLTGFDGDLIDFTHLLNKLAVQYLMDKEEGDNDERED